MNTSILFRNTGCSVPDTGPILQVIALTLPAVALYMGVLSDVYEDAALAQSRYPDPNSDAYEGSGPRLVK